MKILFFLMLLLPASSFAFTLGDNIDVNQPMNINDGFSINFLGGSSLVFPDGTIDSKASCIGPQGPQGVQGVPGLQGLQGPKGDSFVLQIDTFDYNINTSGNWQINISNWLPVDSPHTFNVIDENTYVKVTWTDNIGIYGTNWCNIALFVDGNTSQPPVCSGAWSGVYGTTIFNSQTMVCVVPPLPAGQHTIGVYHRSQYCYYGNSAFDTLGVSRKLIIEQLN